MSMNANTVSVSKSFILCFQPSFPVIVLERTYEGISPTRQYQEVRKTDQLTLDDLAENAAANVSYAAVLPLPLINAYLAREFMVIVDEQTKVD